MGFDIVDDLNVDADYKEVDTTPRPPLPGNYLFKVSSWEFAKEFGTENLKLWSNDAGKPVYPLFNIRLAEIVDPMEHARKVGLFQEVPTALRERDGKRVSEAADLLRAINPDATASNSGEVIEQLSDALNGGLEFRARLDYVGYDKAFVDAQFAAQGGKERVDKATARKIYASGKVRGYTKIRSSNISKNNPKLPIHKWVGPSGNIVDVKPVLTVFYPASDTSVRLGPDAKAVTA